MLVWMGPGGVRRMMVMNFSDAQVKRKGGLN